MLANRLYEPGVYPGTVSFENVFVHWLGPDEKVINDFSYIHNHIIKLPSLDQTTACELYDRISASHETANEHLKSFKALASSF